MQAILLIAGIMLVALAGLGEWLPVAPSSIQTATYSKSLSNLIVPNTVKLTFGGLALIFAAVFFFRGRA